MTIVADVSIPVGHDLRVEADLVLPADALGIVVFAHGSGSSRHSARNRRVADYLHRAGLATLLMDLLTLDEEAIDLQTRHLRFDISLLARRLGYATEWLDAQPETREHAVGYFGASTGAAAALVAAAEHPARVGAVVSRGGRPDLAGASLAHVRAPTLLIVGAYDEAVIELNEAAYEKLQVERRLHIVPGAAHLFEEPGALDTVARRACEWFGTHLRGFQERSS